MGATVLGVDAAERSVAAARAHAARDPLVASRVQYRAGAAEDLVAEGMHFDGVLSLEVVEHVADVNAFASALCLLVAADGLLVMSTVNRTLRSHVLAILAAERVLGLVPNGTHDWSRFLSPEELAGAACLPEGRLAGLSLIRLPQPRSCRAASRWIDLLEWCTRRYRVSGVFPATWLSTT
jgi:2-polyprenyl-6-hydroxyphenyl methylase/3-demethylubiquinone-9 3-methyltransferase